MDQEASHSGPQQEAALTSGFMAMDLSDFYTVTADVGYYLADPVSIILE